MNDIYDESGTVVATHPIQEAQHDGVTVIGLAAQSQVSESDEAVEFVIHRMWDMAISARVLSEDNKVVVGFNVEKAAHVLRHFLAHSQPAAVSADAVDRYKAALETIRTGDCVLWDVADKALKQQHNGS